MQPPHIFPVFEPHTCKQMKAKLLAEKDNPLYFYHDGQCPDALSIVTDKFPSIGQAHTKLRIPNVDVALKPSNWYGRMYLKGNELKRHYDDPHCDYSVTLTIGYESENWPIFIDGIPYMIPIGHGAFYRGCDMEHWREPLQNDYHIQLFFHYVEDK